MKLTDLLKGRKILVETDMRVSVELEIKSIEEEHHSVEVGPSTPENDWWPPTHEWTTFNVTFTNGSTKEYRNLSEINLV